MIINSVRFHVFLFLPIILLFSLSLKGQDRDAGLWTSFSFEAKVAKKLNATISQEFRFNENISELGTSFMEAGLSYKLNKHFQVSADYRFSQKRRVDDYYSFRHRMYIDVKYEKKIKPVQFQFRSRLQDEYADIGRASDGGRPEYYLRNKLNLSFDLDKPYSPYVSVELFSPLNYPYFNAFDNIRTLAGVEYSFSKRHKIELFYMIQKELNVSRPQTDFNLGFGYSFKL